MKLTGVAVPLTTLSNMEPNTVLVAIADHQGAVKVIKIDPASMIEGEAFLKVTADAEQPQAGCWVLMGGQLVWQDPCPQ